MIKFLHKMNYFDDKNILGVILYDGYIPGYSDEKSDVGLYVITNDRTKFIVSEIFALNNVKIEYCERPLCDIYNLLHDSYNNSSLVSIIGSGKILFDRIGEIEKLQWYILEKYTLFLPGIFHNVSINLSRNITNEFVKLQSMMNDNSPFFDYNYYLLIEQIKQFYIRIHGFDTIQAYEAVILYNNKNLQKTDKKGVPDEEFIRLYVESLFCDGDKRINMIRDLYEYSLDGYIDKNICRGNIYSKNISNSEILV